MGMMKKIQIGIDNHINMTICHLLDNLEMHIDFICEFIQYVEFIIKETELLCVIEDLYNLYAKLQLEFRE